MMSTDVYRYELTEKAGANTIWILVDDQPGPTTEEEGEPTLPEGRSP